MRGTDLAEAHRIMEAGESPIRQYTPEEDEEWRRFEIKHRQFCRAHGYHPTRLDRDKMEPMEPQSKAWLKSQQLKQIIASYIPLNGDEAGCPWCTAKLRIKDGRWSSPCGHSGDVYDFVSQYEHVSRERAMEMVETAEEPKTTASAIRNPTKWDEFLLMYRTCCEQWGYIPAKLNRTEHENL